jgi:hypothetical protein
VKNVFLPEREHPEILKGMLGYERYSVSNGSLLLGIMCLPREKYIDRYMATKKKRLTKV